MPDIEPNNSPEEATGLGVIGLTRMESPIQTDWYVSTSAGWAGEGPTGEVGSDDGGASGGPDDIDWFSVGVSAGAVGVELDFFFLSLNREGTEPFQLRANQADAMLTMNISVSGALSGQSVELTRSLGTSNIREEINQFSQVFNTFELAVSQADPEDKLDAYVEWLEVAEVFTQLVRGQYSDEAAALWHLDNALLGGGAYLPGYSYIEQIAQIVRDSSGEFWREQLRLNGEEITFSEEANQQLTRNGFGTAYVSVSGEYTERLFGGDRWITNTDGIDYSGIGIDVNVIDWNEVQEALDAIEGNGATATAQQPDPGLLDQVPPGTLTQPLVQPDNSGSYETVDQPLVNDGDGTSPPPPPPTLPLLTVFTPNADVGRIEGSPRVSALAGDDRVTGDAQNNIIDGMAGNDSLDGGSGNDLLIGGGGNDTLQGGAGDDTMNGGSDQVLSNADGADTFIGGDGADWVNYAGSFGSLRVDLMFSSLNTFAAAGDTHTGIENVMGSQGTDNIRGTSGEANHIVGRRNVDYLYGRSGDDTLDGGVGDDVLFGGVGADLLRGGANRDRVQYSEAIERVVVDLQDPDANNQGEAAGDIYGSIEDAAGSRFGDAIAGDEVANRLFGREGHDQLYGRAGNDYLNGGANNDRLDGGAGNDTLRGGQNADTFVFNGGADVLEDFSYAHADRIAIDDGFVGQVAGLSGSQVVAQFGTVSNSQVVLNFGAEGSITIESLGTMLGLDSEIIVF